MSKFYELFQKVRGKAIVPKVLLAIDPGETTGWSLFVDAQLVDWGQIKLVEDGEIFWNALTELFVCTTPKHIICEDYRIYQHKLQRHSFSPVLTLRLIGAIDYYAYTNKIAIDYQMAAQAKNFVSDEKLKSWSYWQEGQKHARDSIRHGCYFLLFHNRGGNII